MSCLIVSVRLIELTFRSEYDTTTANSDDAHSVYYLHTLTKFGHENEKIR